ncbi:MAG: hypothetical protein GKR95_22235 [Gammaproteobacteria bacterium]|nr:hypothetical protein [Gammaproteobacteria bacterium]
MKSIEYVIILKEPCVFSERNASEGAHRGLDYVPGSALLGAVASRLYSKLDVNESFKLFHSGHVRFGNAYPVNKQGRCTYPLPLSWVRQKKDESVINDDQTYEPSRIWQQDLLDDGTIEGKQPEQMRSGYVSLFGEVVRAESTLALKTSINFNTQRAKEAALFGYDAMKSGQRFFGKILFDDDEVPDDLVDRLSEALEQQLFLGRSRSAEYGQIEIHVARGEVEKQIMDDNADEIRLWFHSDCLVYDQYGQITLCPSTGDLGLLLNLSPDFTRTYIRARQYSPWNGHKHAYDMERQVIGKGSVITYPLGNQTLCHDDLERLSKGFFGFDQVVDLGRASVNSPLVTMEHPQFLDADMPQERIDKGLLLDRAPSQRASLPAASNLEPSLVQWLQIKSGRHDSSTTQEANDITRVYSQLIIEAKQSSGIPNYSDFGPSASQWGQVAGTSAISQSDDDLNLKLFDPMSGVCKASNPGWRDEVFYEGKYMKIYLWLKRILGFDESEPEMKLEIRDKRRFVRLLARDIRRQLDEPASAGQV